MARTTATPLPATDLPLVAAPMAGGATTPDLVAATSGAGALAFLAGGYQTPDALAEQLRVARGLARGLGRPYGVNVFVPPPPGTAPDPAALAAFARRLAPDAAAHGVDLDAALGSLPATDDDGWRAKLDLLRHDPAPVVSFTFGPPPAADVAALRAAGSAVLVTVTTPAEAVAAQELGADGLVVQGPRAGGHSGTWDPARAVGDGATSDVVAAVVARTGLPVVAAGGVDGGPAVARLLHAGARAVAVGTLLLRTDESGASATHRDALADPRYDRTVVTRAFTGRPARALRNGFVGRHDEHAPVGYPQVHHLTRELRRRAAAAGDAERLHLWAGTGYRSAPTGSAADVVRELAAGL
ncbi:nitronate monooxygenase [Isoptericola sp. 4D.3]|uniref:Propionate 3-nitronate monooxygenase n=1 Tax=Isoptericola peretonis TaxID=2918523 RepID=A0ABT0J259_9MICO|nr:nitronate monooxygenase [Isoptericola sp. 4D.3]